MAVNKLTWQAMFEQIIDDVAGKVAGNKLTWQGIMEQLEEIAGK